MKFLRGFLVILGAVILSTLGINAYDNFDTPGASLLGNAISSLSGGPCPKDMVYVGTSDGGFCIDTYEAAPGKDCPNQNPLSGPDTDGNLSVRSCEPVSEDGRLPWRNISRQQAEFACARVGKRLPTNREWYRAALGTPDGTAWGREDCNLDSANDSPDKTGSRESCVSPGGAYDMIGNVWEWLEETVDKGTFENRILPAEGYITSIDEHGVPLASDPYTPDTSFFNDYFWVDPTEVRGMIRGGYWKSRGDGGQYAINVAVPPSFVGTAVGFRCVKDTE